MTGRNPGPLPHHRGFLEPLFTGRPSIRHNILLLLFNFLIVPQAFTDRSRRELDGYARIVMAMRPAWQHMGLPQAFHTAD